MPYRIKIRDAVLECDTPDEAIELVETFDFTERRRSAVPTITASTEAHEPPPPEDEPPQFEDDTARERLIDHLAQRGVAQTVSELAHWCDVPSVQVRELLRGPEFMPHGKGRFKLVPGADPPSDKPAPIEFEEDPPRDAKPAAPAETSDPTMVDRIREVIQKHGPTCSIMLISTMVGEHATAVKNQLRERRDLFKCSPRAGGWSLVEGD